MKKYTGQYIGKKTIPGDVLTAQAEEIKLDSLFTRIKKQPWSPRREKILGGLSTKRKEIKNRVKILKKLYKL